MSFPIYVYAESVNKVLEVFLTALQLGCTAFGGPVAHIGYFREEYVEKRKWVSEERFAELMAVTQFLPGPGSSQLGAAMGYERAGWLGGIAAWVGFTMPSAVLLFLFAIGIGFLADDQIHWIKGLGIAALGVVINALLGMQKKLCVDWQTYFIAILAFGILFASALAMPSHLMVWMQPLVILLGGVMGLVFFYRGGEQEKSKDTMKKAAVAVVMTAVVIAVPFLLRGNTDLEVTGGIFKAGSLVFGGGHVVLPMLEAEVVKDGLMNRQEFLAGYGVTQAMPGPVFTMAGYLGAKLSLFGNPWLGGMVTLLAVFLPGMMLLAVCVPIWDQLKTRNWAKVALKGANASVVGLLGAAVVVLLMKADFNQCWEWLLVVASVALLKYKVTPTWALVVAMGGVGWLAYMP